MFILYQKNGALCVKLAGGRPKPGGTFRPLTPAFSEFQVNSKKIMQQRVLIFPVLNLVIKLHKLQCLL